MGQSVVAGGADFVSRQRKEMVVLDIRINSEFDAFVLAIVE